ncbi:MAG: UDP-N-acetylmuramate dehydrogenase [Patescibacteria group bacterium]
MKKGYQEFLESLGGKRVKLNEPMRLHTTFKIGGPADIFYEVKTKEEIVAAVKLARKLKIPYFILGGGSNILVSDKGIRGVVIKIKNEKLGMKNGRVKAEAGMSLPWLVGETAKGGLSGLEFCAGIPGTVGGAIAGNAGIKDKWIGDLVEEVEILQEDGEKEIISKRECQFGYRQSRFLLEKEIVLGVTLKLIQNNPQSVARRIDKYLKIRKNQPKEPSAGSVFKNPDGESAGKLIEQVGLKGYRIGDAQVSPKHANFIVNLGLAKGRDVLELIRLCQKRVEEKFAVRLEKEIKIIGEL